MNEFCYIAKGKLNVVQEGVIGDIFVQQYMVDSSGKLVKDESHKLVRTSLSIADLYALYSATYEARPLEDIPILLKKLEMLESLMK